MQAKIYLDVQFLTEWVLNLCVVLLTARIVGTGVRFARAALAAAAGALAHVALLAAGVLSGWHFCGGAMPVLGWLLIPVMTGIAFPGKGDGTGAWQIACSCGSPLQQRHFCYRACCRHCIPSGSGCSSGSGWPSLRHMPFYRQDASFLPRQNTGRWISARCGST